MSNVHIIKIDKDSCIGCKNCINDCPQRNIKLIDNKAEIKSQSCMKCGHCVAICPTGAVSITGFDEEPIELEAQRSLDPEDLMYAIKARRSIRSFKNLQIEDNIIDKIIEAGRYTPTAKNMQDVEYIIIDNTASDIEDTAVDVFRKLVKIFGVFQKRYRNIKIRDNFFFMKAPLVIVLASNNSTNAVLAASNMALLAESYGIGVLYSGFFTRACRYSSKLRRRLGVKDKKVQATLVLGYPNVKYERGVQRDEAIVKKID